MGIIKAIASAVGGGLADSWLEVLEVDNMTDTTVLTSGVKVRKNDKRSANKRGTEDLISNGSIIHVGENQFMMLLDGGKVIDYSAEPGYYKVDLSATPSLFNGQLGASIAESFSRIKFGGVPSAKQTVLFINLQEIKGIKFGTRAPINYFDAFYNSELFLRAHGTYSIKIVDPLKFYAEAVGKSSRRVDINDINEQYLNEFLEALQSAINRMSADGIRISYVTGKAQELSRYMAEALDEGWRAMRGMEVQAVGLASISYDDESKELINLRNRGAMLSDPTIREGYVQGAVAEGLKNAGSNPNGAATAFMGMGMGMAGAGNFMGAASATNAQQMAAQREAAAAAAPAAPADGWTCSCGKVNTGKFCSDCGKPKPADDTWTCTCGKVNTGKFCSDCGAKRPEADWVCSCGHKNGAAAKFCSNCGKKKD